MLPEGIETTRTLRVAQIKGGGLSAMTWSPIYSVCRKPAGLIEAQSVEDDVFMPDGKQLENKTIRQDIKMRVVTLEVPESQVVEWVQ